jgi:hypothetical protein
MSTQPLILGSSMVCLDFLPTLKIIGKAQPRNLPNGFISSFLVLLATIGIIAILTGIKYHHILNLEPSVASKGVADCISLSSKGDDNFSRAFQGRLFIPFQGRVLPQLTTFSQIALGIHHFIC